MAWQAQRTRAEIAYAVDADEYLEDAYGVRLNLRRKHIEKIEGPLLTHARVASGTFAIDEMSIAGQVESEAESLNKLLVLWTTGGRVHSECDGKESTALAGDVILTTQPDLPHASMAEDVRATAVLLDPAEVSGVATGMPDGHAALPVRFSSLTPTDDAAAQMWKRSVTYVRDELLADDALATPLVIGHARRLLAALALSTFPNELCGDDFRRDQTATRPVVLRRAMEFMEANAANDIALGDVAAAVHLTPRAVQYMFRRHLETTPIQYLRKLRLHYAHQDLVASAPPHDNVANIAARWGFAHTGRFAVLYRQTYGRSPHQTLRGS